jgi:hypothetical protein
MSAATMKRNTGAQSRRAPVRLFALVDRDLAKPSGLSPSMFCRDYECSLDTLMRYILELVSSGKRVAQVEGIWKYEDGEERLFTDSGCSLFERD